MPIINSRRMAALLLAVSSLVLPITAGVINTLPKETATPGGSPLSALSLPAPTAQPSQAQELKRSTGSTPTINRPPLPPQLFTTFRIIPIYGGGGSGKFNTDCSEGVCFKTKKSGTVLYLTELPKNLGERAPTPTGAPAEHELVQHLRLRGLSRDPDNEYRTKIATKSLYYVPIGPVEGGVGIPKPPNVPRPGGGVSILHANLPRKRNFHVPDEPPSVKTKHKASEMFMQPLPTELTRRSPQDDTKFSKEKRAPEALPVAKPVAGAMPTPLR